MHCELAAYQLTSSKTSMVAFCRTRFSFFTSIQKYLNGDKSSCCDVGRISFGCSITQGSFKASRKENISTLKYFRTAGSSMIHCEERWRSSRFARKWFQICRKTFGGYVDFLSLIQTELRKTAWSGVKNMGTGENMHYCVLYCDLEEQPVPSLKNYKCFNFCSYC